MCIRDRYHVAKGAEKNYNIYLKAITEEFKKTMPGKVYWEDIVCLLYTSPSPRDRTRSRMPSSALKKKRKHSLTEHGIATNMLVSEVMAHKSDYRYHA